MSSAREEVFHSCQAYLTHNPVLIVGSGSSAAYGLPTMAVLANELQMRMERRYPKLLQDSSWKEFEGSINELGLEQAIDESNIWKNEGLYGLIRNIVWKIIIEKDQEVFQKITDDNIENGFTKYFDFVGRSSEKTIQVVTTNYDRLIEFGAGKAGFHCDTGFNASYFGAWRSNRNHLEFWSKGRRASEKTIRLNKVHGSVDWFIDADEKIRFQPNSTDIPLGSQPLIVPPSIQKNSDTHMEPFRSLIQDADTAIQSARVLICVGYGFQDDHLQVKIAERVSQSNTVILLLVKELTDAASRFLEKSATEYLVLEKGPCSSTKVSGTNFSDPEILEECQIWDFREFGRKVIA